MNIVSGIWEAICVGSFIQVFNANDFCICIYYLCDGVGSCLFFFSSFTKKKSSKSDALSSKKGG